MGRFQCLPYLKTKQYPCLQMKPGTAERLEGLLMESGDSVPRAP